MPRRRRSYQVPFAFTALYTLYVVKALDRVELSWIVGIVTIGVVYYFLASKAVARMPPVACTGGGSGWGELAADIAPYWLAFCVRQLLGGASDVANIQAR